MGALEMALVEGIALLLCKQGRLDRSELAVQVSNLRQHDLERRKLSLQVGTGNSDAVELEVREKGLSRSIDSPGKFEQVLGFLTSLLAMIDKNEFGYEMREALIALHGSDFTLRGVKLDEFRYALAKMPQGEAFEKAKRDMTGWVAEEMADVGREYELYLHEHVENTRAARMAATAPSQAQWAVIIRQQNSLDRQLEHKIRLLMELQRERKSEARESLEASSPPDPSDPQDGGPGLHQPAGGASDVPSFGMSAPVRFGTHTSRQNASECMRLSPESRQERDADMPDSGTSEPPQGQQTAAFGEKTQNRGNEAKNSLKTNEVGKTMCPKPTHSCARNASYEAKKGSFRCKQGWSTLRRAARAGRTARCNRRKRVSMSVDQSVAVQS